MDPYTILGVFQSASPSEIRSQYRKLSLQLHPDKAGEGSTAAFQRLQAAYSKLTRQASVEDEPEEFLYTPEEGYDFDPWNTSAAKAALDASCNASPTRSKKATIQAEKMGGYDAPAFAFFPPRKPKASAETTVHVGRRAVRHAKRLAEAEEQKGRGLLLEAKERGAFVLRRVKAVEICNESDNDVLDVENYLLQLQFKEDEASQSDPYAAAKRLKAQYRDYHRQLQRAEKEVHRYEARLESELATTSKMPKKERNEKLPRLILAQEVSTEAMVGGLLKQKLKISQEKKERRALRLMHRVELQWGTAVREGAIIAD